MIKKVALRLLLLFGIFVAVLVVNLVIFTRVATRITEGVPIENRDPEQVALLVIDIQEGTTGAASVTEPYILQADSFISDVNRLVHFAEEQGWTIIWIRSEVANPLLNVLNNTLAKGTLGAELDGRLDTSQGHVVVKRRSDSFNRTELDALLEEKNIGHLVVSGLDAERCVLSTIQAAENRGYPLTVFEETILSKEEERMAEILDAYRDLGVDVRRMD
jgi:nicotinamidase-related amidase